jgi:hypothetical protein
LPLRALLYVRAKDVGWLTLLYGIGFRTKLAMAAELVLWAADWLRYLGKVLGVVTDGAYADRPFLQAARAAGVVVVSRLRRDAALWSVPVPRPGAPKRRGRPPTYGKQAISLARRAGQCRGWRSEELVLYGKAVTKTYRPAGGLIRVVLVCEEDGWVAFFCTDPTATAAELLAAVADRAAVEQDYHDIKEVHGAGQQQVRHYWANVAAFRRGARRRGGAGRGAGAGDARRPPPTGRPPRPEAGRRAAGPCTRRRWPWVSPRLCRGSEPGKTPGRAEGQLGAENHRLRPRQEARRRRPDESRHDRRSPPTWPTAARWTSNSHTASVVRRIPACRLGKSLPLQTPGRLPWSRALSREGK